MTDDLATTHDLDPTTLPTALRDLADSNTPRVMDVETVLRHGKQSVARRRMAALGGGTAVLAVTGLVAGVLAPAGSAGHRDMPDPAPAAINSPSASRSSDPAMGATPGPTTGSTAPTPSSPFDPAKGAYLVDPRDPVMTIWQPGYLPPGMTALGGEYTPGLPNADWTTLIDPAGFEIAIQQQDAEISFGGPTVAARIQGAKQAFWADHGNGSIVSHNGADLAWQRSDGQWMLMQIRNVSQRADWQAQALEVAARLGKMNLSVPMPFSVTGAKGLYFNSGGAGLQNGAAMSVLTFDSGPERSSKGQFQIFAFKTGTSQIEHDVPPQNQNTCKDSNGLTICVSTSMPVPAPLAAIGGPKALLADVTSLGNDPANWTTNVLR